MTVGEERGLHLPSHRLVEADRQGDQTAQYEVPQSLAVVVHVQGEVGDDVGHGLVQSTPTPTMQGLKAPWESSVSWRLRRRRERRMKDCSLVVGSDPEQRLVRTARTVRGKWPVTAPDCERILRNISSCGETGVQPGEERQRERGEGEGREREEGER